MPSETAPNEREALAWRAIRDNVRLAQAFVADATAERFSTDRKTFYEDSGNVFRHQYQVVAATRVWLTVQERLPDLLAAANAALGEAD